MASKFVFLGLLANGAIANPTLYRAMWEATEKCAVANAQVVGVSARGPGSTTPEGWRFDHESRGVMTDIVPLRGSHGWLRLMASGFLTNTSTRAARTLRRTRGAEQSIAWMRRQDRDRITSRRQRHGVIGSCFNPALASRYWLHFNHAMGLKARGRIPAIERDIYSMMARDKRRQPQTNLENRDGTRETHPHLELDHSWTCAALLPAISLLFFSRDQPKLQSGPSDGNKVQTFGHGRLGRRLNEAVPGAATARRSSAGDRSGGMDESVWANMKIIYLALAAFAGLAVANPMGDRSLDLALDKRAVGLRKR
ncbi:hypothetical protein ACCO45_002777 [Purpureocillium lilacinum]|uniref:Uncharacterized protein n=1 Tax=Purpureocillium lilacinum TaxID=33203 RepID=A0ACC4DZE7_PURLI